MNIDLDNQAYVFKAPLTSTSYKRPQPVEFRKSSHKKVNSLFEVPIPSDKNLLKCFGEIKIYRHYSTNKRKQRNQKISNSFDLTSNRMQLGATPLSKTSEFQQYKTRTELNKTFSTDRKIEPEIKPCRKIILRTPVKLQKNLDEFFELKTQINNRYLLNMTPQQNYSGFYFTKGQKDFTIRRRTKFCKLYI